MPARAVRSLSTSINRKQQIKVFPAGYLLKLRFYWLPLSTQESLVNLG